MSRILLNRKQMLALLNWANRNDISHFEIEIPWIQGKILDGVISDFPVASVTPCFTRHQFASLAKEVEVTYYSLMQTLTSAGIIHPLGWTKVMEGLLKEQVKGQQDGHNPQRIAFDTNALICRIFSQLEEYKQSLPFYSPKDVTWEYVLASGVRIEITNFERKYKRNDIEKLNDVVPCSWIDYHSFLNQLVGMNRMFRLGTVEMRKMIATDRCLILDSRPGDANIIKALQEHKAKQHADVVVLTCDVDFDAICRARGIQSHRLDIPTSIKMKKIETGWKSFIDLVYVLAIRMGAVRLLTDDDKEILVHGIWSGKKDEWDREMVWIETSADNLRIWLSQLISIGHSSLHS